VDWDEIRRRQDQIPGLYSTEGEAFSQKTLFQRYCFRRPAFYEGRLRDTRGFNWLLAELDSDQIAFGYGNLNDDQNAEWGLIYLPDVIGTGATRDRRWLPMKFPDALRLVYGYKENPGSREHHDWWLYENMDQLEKEHRLIGPHRMTLSEYCRRAYAVEYGLKKPEGEYA
jgi:hypothetical protein